MTDQQQNQSEAYMPDEIRADRACIGCGFNLYGQTVTKEPHYGMAITRCPECGTVAALQTYPSMSHWVNRFRSIIAAVWIVLLLGALAGSTVVLTGLSLSATELASENLAEIIGASHEEWGKAKEAQAAAVNATGGTTPTAAPTTTTTTLPTVFNGTTTITTTTGTTVVFPGAGSRSFRWVTISEEWRKDHLDSTIEQAGGVWANVDGEFLIMLIPGIIVGVLCGVFWSVTLLGGTKRRAILVPLVACFVAAAIVIGINSTDSSFQWAREIARGYYAPIIVPIMIGVQFTAISVGVFAGRKIARFVVVMALPARNRVPLSLLWTCEGHSLPKPK